MTVIAWDGTTLAADKRTLNGRTVGTVTKIFRVGRDLVGMTGGLASGMELLNWYRAGAEPSTFPEKNRDPDKCTSLVVIRADGSVWEFQNTPHPYKMDDKCCAWGCGDEAALVAMACGKTAVEAVLLASRFNNGCGDGVDSLTLEQES